MITNAYMASVVSNGGTWTDGKACPKGNVIICTAEDDPEDTLYPRLQAHGADMSRIMYFRGVESEDGKRERALTLADVELLEAMIDQIGDVKLVVIDPIGAYCGDADSNNQAEVRGMMAPLAKMAMRKNIALVLVAHLKKSNGKSGTDPVVYRIAGSLGFGAAARFMWLVTPDPDDPQRCLFLNPKANISKKSTGLAYRVVDVGKIGIFDEAGKVEWESGEVNLTPDEVLEQPKKRGPKPSKQEDAADFLLLFLAKGPRHAADVRAAAMAIGISEATLRRAKEHLRVISETCAPYNWSLPRSTANPDPFTA